MTVVIPVWLLWVLGIAGGVIVLLLAVIGVFSLFVYREWARAWNRTWGW